LREDITALITTLKKKEHDSESSSSEDDGQEESQLNNCLFESIDEIKAGLTKLHDAMLVIPRETHVLQHLYFDYIFSREDSIVDASTGTFSWIMHSDAEFHQYRTSWTTKATEPGKSEHANEIDTEKEKESYSDDLGKMDRSRCLLQKWLTTGDEEVFHICGKAGSEKSTLFNLILNDQRTSKYLQRWVGQKTLVIASFYFWKSENTLVLTYGASPA